MQDHVVALLLLFKGIFLLFSVMKLYLFLTIFYKNGVGPAVLRLPPIPCVMLWMSWLTGDPDVPITGYCL